jgi:shikimate kinase
MKSHIAIIGMPWSGKTTTSLALARKLKIDVIDLDQEVEKIEGKDLIQVMNEKGAQYFRDLGYNFLLTLRKPTIISPAGSIIYHDPSMKWLKENAQVVFLDTPIDILDERMQKQPKAVADLKEKGLKGLFEKRYPMYAQAADFILSTKGKTPETIANEIAVLMINE